MAYSNTAISRRTVETHISQRYDQKLWTGRPRESVAYLPS